MARKVQRVDELSPDGYSRFFVLCGIIKATYGRKKGTLKILDVGGGSEYMQQQLDKTGVVYDLTVIDMIERPARMKATYIQGDATAMEFADNSFDLVISTDVMEHVQPKRKQAFLDECLRVAGGLCIIAAPFDTPGVHDAEITVNEFNKKLFGVGQDWLVEHLELGKPSRKMFLDTLKKQKIVYDEFGTQNINTWLLNTQTNLIDAKLGLSSTRHIAANRYYNENILHMNEFQGPTYRHFFVMYIDTKLPRFDYERYLSSPADHAKIAQYSNMIMSLYADRIRELSRSEKKLAITNYHLNEQYVAARQRIDGLQEIIARQDHTLDKIRPLIRLLRSPSAKLRHNNHNAEEGNKE